MNASVRHIFFSHQLLNKSVLKQQLIKLSNLTTTSTDKQQSENGSKSKCVAFVR